MSNTQEMPVVPAAVAVEAENVQIPYSPNVRSRFKVVAEFEKQQIHARAQQAIDQIRAQEADEIAQWDQMLATVEEQVPEPTLRVGQRPYADGEMSEAQEKALAGYVKRPLRSDDSEGRS